MVVFTSFKATKMQVFVDGFSLGSYKKVADKALAAVTNTYLFCFFAIVIAGAVIGKLLIEIAPYQVVQPRIRLLPCRLGRQHARRNAAYAQICAQAAGAFSGGEFFQNRIEPDIFFELPPLFVRFIFSAALRRNHILLSVPRWKRRHFNRDHLKNLLRDRKSVV